MLVRSERDGALAIGAGGIHISTAVGSRARIRWRRSAPNAADHVRRTDGFAHCPDLVVNSTYWPAMGEVAAFEELVGSHGGMGGGQSFPFVLLPVRARVAGGAGRRRGDVPPDPAALARRARAGGLRRAAGRELDRIAGIEDRRLDPRRQRGELIAEALGGSAQDASRRRSRSTRRASPSGSGSRAEGA